MNEEPKELWIVESPLVAVPDCVKHAKRFAFEGFCFSSEAEANAWVKASGGAQIYRLTKLGDTPVLDCGEFQEREKNMSTTMIETADYRLPLTSTRLLARTLFESGWIRPADLEKLACLWSLDAPDLEVKRAVDEVFIPSYIAANTKFKIIADELSAKLGRELTDAERLGVSFPHGKYYAAAQNIINEWFESQMRNVSALVN